MNKLTGTKVTTRTIHRDNRSGTFSAKAEYTPIDNNKVNVDEWVFDSLGILPSGWENRIMDLADARTEYRERLSNGWKT